MFKTELIRKHTKTEARVTKIIMPHGEVATPAFMPVGTKAMVNCMSPSELQVAGSQIILGGNTYHMLVSPGTEVIRSLGGMHRFMGWEKPMLTDSGGFQVFSLSQDKKLCKIDEEGAHFKHPVTGKIVHLTPQTSIATQKIIGADIIMAFDQCTPETGGRTMAEMAMERTHRWLVESKAAHEAHLESEYGDKQALFGIIQGGSFKDLREESAEFVLNMDLDGIAIGGESIGFDMQKTKMILDWVCPVLPEDKTRYTMGVGLYPQDLIEVVQHGVDIFDCVAPTRNARHGSLYCGHTVPTDDFVTFNPLEDDDGRMYIKKSKYRTDERPIVEGCTCYTCQHFTRAYLHYLFKERLLLYYSLACIHNVHTMHEVCRIMREVILKR